jgi:hypothetical protein
MTLTQMLQDEQLSDGLAVFGSLYAKQMMEAQYDRFMTTWAGQRLDGLSRPAKLGIEAALNLLAAYASTKLVSLTGCVLLMPVAASSWLTTWPNSSNSPRDIRIAAAIRR